MSDTKVITSAWKAKNIALVYHLDDRTAEIIQNTYADQASFSAAIQDFQKSYNATRQDAISTVVSWAVNHEETKNIDEDVWRENNRLTGANV